MARINVDDVWFLDLLSRRKALQKAVELGERDVEAEADGLAVRAWRMAQHYWKEDRLIPEDSFRRAGLEPLLECDLAEIREDGVYVRGSEERHAWLKKRVVAGRNGGHQSAESRRNQSGSAVPQGASNSPKQNRSSAEAKPKQTASTAEAPPKPLALALALTLSDTSKEVSTPKSAPDPEDPLDLELADSWGQFAVSVSKTVKVDRDKWAREVRLLREKNGFTLEQLRALLEFVRTDDFWRTNVASLPALRSRSKNGLLKIENLKAAAEKIGFAVESQEDRMKIYEGIE